LSNHSLKPGGASRPQDVFLHCGSACAAAEEQEKNASLQRTPQDVFGQRMNLQGVLEAGPAALDGAEDKL